MAGGDATNGAGCGECVAWGTINTWFCAEFEEFAAADAVNCCCDGGGLWALWASWGLVAVAGIHDDEAALLLLVELVASASPPSNSL